MDGAGRLMLLQNGQLLRKHGGFESALKIRFKSIRSEEINVRAEMVHRAIAYFFGAAFVNMVFNIEN